MILPQALFFFSQQKEVPEKYKFFWRYDPAAGAFFPAKRRFLENKVFVLCLKQSATGKMTVVTVWSFHGFGEKVSSAWYLPVKSMFCIQNTICQFSL